MRVKSGKPRNRSKKRWFKAAKGNFGGRSKLLQTVKETVVRARAFAFRDRRLKKREYRALWITRLNAGCQMHGIRYSEFIHGLKAANIELNRKSLSELAINEPAIFAEIVEIAKSAAEKSKAA